MFTGIIEEMGMIEEIRQTGEAIVMKVSAQKIVEDVQLGDSISVNGVCLTVTSFSKNSFTVDIMPETVKATSLNQLNRGDRVNLERAMSANGRFGGHMVSGHVDGTGRIVSKKQAHNAVYFQIKVEKELSDYIIQKGSVTVDGISLTVFAVEEQAFTISIIPHTLKETILGIKDVGDIVNIECDIVGKYIETFITRRFDQPASSTSISANFLADHGFK